MCGFAGYKTAHDTTIDDAILHSLSEVLVHRGPDDDGIWRSDDHKIALVSRRLSIRDPSKAGRHPMMDQKRNIIIVFN